MIISLIKCSYNYILDFHLLDASIIPLDTQSFIVLFLWVQFLPPRRGNDEPCFALILSIQYSILSSLFIFILNIFIWLAIL